MLRGFLALLLAPALIAQTPATGSIVGVVRDAGTDAPLSGVHVSLGGTQTVTDPQGRFRFEAVDAGLNRLWASDKTRGTGAGVSVLVHPGEETSADIRLKLGATIAGRVIDSVGQPVANAIVMLLARRYRYGELVFSPTQSVATNAAGEYRLSSVIPDRGVLLLAKKVLKVTSVDELPSYNDRETVLLPELHPQIITVSSGEVRGHVDVRILASPAYCVEGSVNAPAGKQVYVSFTEHLSFDSGWSLTPSTIKASADGKFRACGLHVGSYRVAAATAPPGGNLRDRFAEETAVLGTGETTISNKDTRDLKLLTTPSVVIVGDTAFDPPPREKPRRVQIGLTRSINGGEGYADSTEKPATFGMYGMVGASRGGTEVPGPFNLGHWRPGDWDLQVSRLSAGCYVKEATCGTRDLLRAPLRINDAPSSERLRIVIGCDGGSLSARVTDKDGNPVPSAVLYVFSVNAATPGALAATLRRADIAGGFSAPLTALPPGKYLALVSDLDISPLDAPADEIEELWRTKGAAKEVEIGPGAMVQLAITYNVVVR
jgi:hypothetical protein